MDERKRRTKRVTERRTADGGGRRRVDKEDGKFADYSSLRSSSGIVIPEVKRVLLDRKREVQPVHRTSIIFPSEMSKTDWCPRATYFRMSGKPDPSSKPSFTLENVFAEGNSIHSKWQNWLSETDKLWGDWKCYRCAAHVKNSLKPEGSAFNSPYGACVGTDWVNIKFTWSVDPLNPEKYEHDWRYKEVTLRSNSLPVGGHADGALTEHNILIELKSLGIGSLRFEAPKLLEENTYVVDGKKIIDIDGVWKNFHRPLTAHLRQGNIYLWMAKEMGLPFDQIAFIYEFKANQQVKEFVVSMSDEILAPIFEKSVIVKEALVSGLTPECQSGTSCMQCRPYILGNKSASS